MLVLVSVSKSHLPVREALKVNFLGNFSQPIFCKQWIRMYPILELGKTESVFIIFTIVLPSKF